MGQLQTAGDSHLIRSKFWGATIQDHFLTTLGLKKPGQVSAGRPCRPLGRSGRLAPIDAPRRAVQHHHYRPAAKMPRTQPSRERLLIFDRGSMPSVGLGREWG